MIAPARSQSVTPGMIPFQHGKSAHMPKPKARSWFETDPMLPSSIALNVSPLIVSHRINTLPENRFTTSRVLHPLEHPQHNHVDHLVDDLRTNPVQYGSSHNLPRRAPKFPQ